MPHYLDEFPFEEIRQPNDLYFENTEDAIKHTGCSKNQIWSICEENNTFVYGPGYHFINLLGFVVTNEKHDGDTYYEEECVFDIKPREKQ